MNDKSLVVGDNLDELKVPPHAIEAEQSVIGALLLDNLAWDKIADKISEEDFYRQEHRLIYQEIKRLVNQSHPADIVTVAESLENNHCLTEIGGLVYLSALVNNTPSSANILRYVEIVRERSIMRQLIAASIEIAETAYVPQGRDIKEILDGAENKIFQIAENTHRNRQGFNKISLLLTRATERIDLLCQRDNPNEVTGVPTGFIDLDKKTSGLQDGDLIIVAGRPSMGKTAFAMNMAEHAAINHHLPVIIFSMETSGVQLVTRMLGSVGRIDQQVLRTGQLKNEDWPKLREAISNLSETHIYIDETPALTVLELRARARRMARQFDGKVGLIIVDYIQLMSGNNIKNDNRSVELGEISRGLKTLAKELNVPVIALSQLSRLVEHRTDKRPVMSDLRESGAIEQDADLIIFMYRDEYYNPDSPNKGLAEAIISKQRNGPTGKIHLAFLGNLVRFDNATQDWSSTGQSSYMPE
ncbi:MAG: replicative DNA helicase [Neisseriales bacterium]|nr:MAG: replicative DNA helicase [Neisseriales bacterium]